MRHSHTKTILCVFWLKFCSALPWAILGSTMQAWLNAEKISIETIGALGLARLPYSVRFLWTPFMHRIHFFRLDSYRSCLIASKLGLFLCLLIFSSIHPGSHFFILSIISLLIGFLGATQANAVDAFQLEAFDQQHLRLAATYGSFGFRLGLTAAGAGVLFLADRMDWSKIFLILSFFLFSGALTVLLIPNKHSPASSPMATNLWTTLKEPFLEFFQQKNLKPILAFLFLYKINIVLAISLITKFFIDIGFSHTQIAYAKIGNIFFSAFGVFLGNLCLKYFNLYTSLWIFEVLEMFSGSILWFLALSEHNFSLFLLAVLMQDLTNGMGNCGYEVFTMSLCAQKKYSSTHLTFINSLNAFKRSLITWPAGIFVAHLGWAYFFLIAVLSGIPSLILLYKYNFGKNSL